MKTALKESLLILTWKFQVSTQQGEHIPAISADPDFSH